MANSQDKPYTHTKVEEPYEEAGPWNPKECYTYDYEKVTTPGSEEPKPEERSCDAPHTVTPLSGQEDWTPPEIPHGGPASID